MNDSFKRFGFFFLIVCFIFLLTSYGTPLDKNLNFTELLSIVICTCFYRSFSSMVCFYTCGLFG